MEPKPVRSGKSSFCPAEESSETIIPAAPALNEPTRRKATRPGHRKI
jgi:hypothetical protein